VHTKWDIMIKKSILYFDIDNTEDLAVFLIKWNIKAWIQFDVDITLRMLHSSVHNEIASKLIHCRKQFSQDAQEYERE
jgi:hypothetical protein